MKKLIIFGNTIVAELAKFYFTRDAEYEVVAFTVDRSYINNEELNGLPIIPFEELEEKYDNKNHEIFLAIGPNKMNNVREKKFFDVKAKGYKFASYISKYAIVNSKLGENCLVADGVIINPFSKIGSNNFFWEQSLISSYTKIKDNCYFAPKVTISSYCLVEDNSVFGIASVIKAKVKISKKTLIGANSYISKNTKENGVYGVRNSDFLGAISSKINISL
jgi:sugar O-acyltransferase (sialic acid O-acetyltransferase NeuD family)